MKSQSDLNQEIQSLKELVNQLLVQNAFLQAECHISSDILSKLMPAKEASNVYTNFVDVLEEQQLDALDHLEEVLLDPEPSFLLKKKFERSSFFQTMKLDGRYNSELNSD
mgnify:CR=1 FL=1